MDQEIEDQRSRYGFSALEKAEVWDRWARGESLKAIGRGFGKPSSSIRGQLSPSGGIRPACPSSKQMGLLSVFHKGGSGSSLFDVKPLGVDGSSGGFGWSVF